MLAFLVLAAAAAGCADEEPTAPATTPSTAPAASTNPPASSTTAAAAPTLVPAGGVRAQACQDFLPFLQDIAQHDQAAARTTAEQTITNLPSTPEWAGMSEADRAATIAGIRDAASGTCQ